MLEITLVKPQFILRVPFETAPGASGAIVGRGNWAEREALRIRTPGPLVRSRKAWLLWRSTLSQNQ
jgi:hypothetical protein